MAVYCRGSRGAEVRRIQEELAKRGLYSGPLDGIFGGGTESAVARFQRRSDLLVDGKVGEQTWGDLFGDETDAEQEIVLELDRAHDFIVAYGCDFFRIGERIVVLPVL